MRGGVLHVRLAAAPVDGAANDELIALIARTLRIARRHVQLVRGTTSRLKVLHIDADEAAIHSLGSVEPVAKPKAGGRR